jgi:hypothetical protein
MRSVSAYLFVSNVKESSVIYTPGIRQFQSFVVSDVLTHSVKDLHQALSGPMYQDDYRNG